MKALIVEDYVPLQKSVSKAIREMGWAVDVAADGEEGQWFVDNHAYDVILLDLMLPKVAGLEILRQLRGRGNSTPVLILTAKDAVEDRTKGLDLGADDYLVKPFSLAELEALLRALLRRQRPQLANVLRVADLELGVGGYSPANVREVRRCIDTAARHSGFILSTSCEIPPRSKPEIVQWFMDATREYGRYERFMS